MTRSSRFPALLLMGLQLGLIPGWGAQPQPRPTLPDRTLDLRQPMALAAHAIVARLDPAQDYRPWFLLRGRGGIPVQPEHASWDLGDMTGRYLESLIQTRRMGVCRPELSEAESRLARYLLKLLGPDGLVHDPATGRVDHTFSQGSALYGLMASFEDSGDPAVRTAIERLITGMLKRLTAEGDQLVDPTVKLEQSSGSHLAGYQIYPVVRFYELTGCPEAIRLAEGLARWVVSDPVLGAEGAITKPLSWEGHIHSWLDALAGCVRAARVSTNLDRAQIIGRARAVYDWVQRSNATPFGWIATYPTGGSSETCAISSAIRLALELVAAGCPDYMDDVERFVRNQVVEAQFRDLNAYRDGPRSPTPLLLGCFDCQSMPNCHLGTRGGEDVGTVEGCCLNGGMRALALAWDASQTADEQGVTVHLALNRNGPAAEVISFQPFEGRVDIIPRAPGTVRVRIPPWVSPRELTVSVNRKKTEFILTNHYVQLSAVPAKTVVSIRYSLREIQETVRAGGQTFRIRWKGDTVVGVEPKSGREPTYRRRLEPAAPAPESPCRMRVPDTYVIEDAARLAAFSMLSRLDLDRSGQPFFRIYPFADPPRAEHEKWDDGDMTGRYVEALILARDLTGLPIDPRERLLREYLAGLFDPADGLCYTRPTSWTPRRACLFSQSSAMLGLLAWHGKTGSPAARELLDRHVAGLMRLAVDRGNYVYFPKYEFDGRQFVDDPKDKDAPTWYGGRLILPLVQYWQLTGRADVKEFLTKLIRYSTEISQGIKPDGEVRGNGWWGHLHSTMDMAAGIAEFGRLTARPELVAWAKRVYDWIGRTHTTRYGWVADAAGSHICESCAIASRIRLGLALYHAGQIDPFGDIDRYVRNQLLENQFVDLPFLHPLKPETARTGKITYAGIDCMIRGTFQCWGTANDLIGHTDIEGCGAGGGVQGLALAWDAQSEWRDLPEGQELRIHLLFNRRIHAPAAPPLTRGTPVAAELWSWLPFEGRVALLAHQPIARLALRLPDGAAADTLRLRRSAGGRHPPLQRDSPYVLVPNINRGEQLELRFALNEYPTLETAKARTYKVQWRGDAVVGLEPKGTNAPLYAGRLQLKRNHTPLCAPRYP